MSSLNLGIAIEKPAESSRGGILFINPFEGDRVELNRTQKTEDDREIKSSLPKFPDFI